MDRNTDMVKDMVKETDMDRDRGRNGQGHEHGQGRGMEYLC
jgi:hypothetical protein